MSKKFKAKHNPLFTGDTPLQFDNVEEDALLELTDDQKKDRFIAKWMEIVDPYVTFEKVFLHGDKKSDHLLAEIKNFYKRFVLLDDWSEKKYVEVINNIFELRSPFYPKTIENFGKMFDNDQLVSQRRRRRKARRGR